MENSLFLILFCANVLSFCVCQSRFDYNDDHKDNVDYMNAEAPQEDSDKAYNNYDENDNNDITFRNDNVGNNGDILQDDNDGANDNLEKYDENNDDLLRDEDYDVNNDDLLQDDADYDANELKGNGNGEDDPIVAQEFNQGDLGDFLGSNLHRYVPQNYAYSDLGRRFIPVYPYFENKFKEANRQKFEDTSQDPIPRRAPPEVVLAMAQQAGLLQGTKPRNYNREQQQKNILRTGDYWNSVWKEDADPDPKPVLRTNILLRKPLFKTKDKLGKVQAKVYPGSKLYSLLSKLNDDAPELLYLINVHDDK